MSLRSMETKTGPEGHCLFATVAMREGAKDPLVPKRDILLAAAKTEKG